MPSKINNDFYNELGDDWYEADNHAIALLRAEQKVKNKWVKSEVLKRYEHDISILDIACGGGFLTNYLAQDFTSVTGVDASESSLAIAKKNDATKKVDYQYADAYQLPFEDNRFEVVCLMDFLEHVESPAKVISEAARVLKPGGMMFYHTFNRNLLSHLIIIKAVEWLVPNAPKNLHVHELFIKPEELEEMLTATKLRNTQTIGIKPKFNSAFFKSILKRRVLPEFDFELTSNLKLGYMGVALNHD